MAGSRIVFLFRKQISMRMTLFVSFYFILFYFILFNELRTQQLVSQEEKFFVLLCELTNSTVNLSEGEKTLLLINHKFNR